MTVTRKRVSMLVAAAALGTALAVPATATAAQQGGDSVASAQAYSCSIKNVNGKKQAGYYSGNSVVPSSGSVTSAGIEAQCILKAMGYPTGTVDGIFGTNSKKAMRQFQTDVNKVYGRTVLSVDGLPGPQSWPYLRTFW
ncbi:peptidoglycan-binding domain-containing protein [Streptomyces mayonensis]|uniref:peptidoglycan-binding domain-containing protein n=1 Tax=Streptomyces mayonensis TaxID=2750816 RepID=UPI001C1DCF87|nr:peptidoglycan-binding domain-containing protein [Streptomyces sp. A108]MBU6535852.1 peptidoglycan-binding protein [Streptomyces sp. A108]